MTIDVDQRAVLRAVREVGPALRAGPDDPGTHRLLADGLLAGWPAADEFVAAACRRLDRDGFVVIQVPGLSTLPRTMCRGVVISVSSLFGVPSPVAGSRQVLWDVRPATGQPDISGTTGEAALHTDSAFAPFPERYFGLWCLTAAQDGGESVFVDGPAVLAELDRQGRTGEVLRSRPAPFWDGVTCRRFRIAGDGRREPGIRFRADLIDFTRDAPQAGDDEVRSAVCGLDAALEQAPRTRVSLGPDQAVLIDNHRLLHGRTAFRDTRRHLLRLRMRSAGDDSG